MEEADVLARALEQARDLRMAHYISLATHQPERLNGELADFKAWLSQTLGGEVPAWAPEAVSEGPPVTLRERGLALVEFIERNERIARRMNRKATGT